MRRMIAILLTLLLAFGLVSCGGGEEKGASENEAKEYEIAMVVDGAVSDESSFSQATWQSIEAFAGANEMTAKCYKAKESTAESYLATIQKAVDKKAKLIVMTGSNFETTVYTAQSMYPDVYFLLIDGVPHDGNNTYAAAANTIGIIFAEEEAGFLAGYAAVKDGYKKLGFMGGPALPSVKRYGYGFVQGAAAAAAETETKVELRYTYTGSFEATDEAQALAAGWYEAGTKVIFACGGSMGNSVMKAAEKGNGKVIGVDVDQSGLSETVITSAEKSLATVIEDMLEQYTKDNFIGGTAFNYAAKNDGVSLEMDNARFNTFTQEDYKKILRKLENGKIELKKDTGVNTPSELAGEWVTVIE